MHARERYTQMLRDRVTPGLRQLGFRGGRGRYRLPTPCGDYALLGFQRSIWNDEQVCEFTVNVARYGRAAWQQAREQAPELPAAPNPSDYYGFYGDLGWQERLGHLMPYSHDHWWGFDPSSDRAAIGQEVFDAIRVYALPALTAAEPPQTLGDAHSQDCGSRFCPAGRALT